MRTMAGLLAGGLVVGALLGAGPRPAAVAGAATTAVDFNGVATTSASDAWIVGTTEVGTEPVQTLTVHWNGHSWRRVPSPGAGGHRTSTFLYDVAASSPANAWAVGQSTLAHGSTLIECWNGRAWKVVPSPSPHPNRQFSLLDAVTVRTRTDAWAVGSIVVGPGSNSHTLIEHWNGTAWTLVPSPSVTATGGDQVQNDLNDVTEISPSNVWAVGTSITGSNATQTLILHWNGTKWSIVPSPDPQGAATPTYLLGIAAISRANIFAVGWFGLLQDGTSNLIARWNGASWQTVPGPANSNAFESLSDVAAISATDAWAVGEYQSQSDSNSLALIQHWNGTKWQSVRAPRPRGSVGDSLGAIAAASAKSIWAIGDSFVRSGQQPLVMYWNGVRWTVQVVSLTAK